MKTICLSKMLNDLIGRKLVNLSFGFDDESGRTGMKNKIIKDVYIEQCGDVPTEFVIWLDFKGGGRVNVYSEEEITVE